MAELESVRNLKGINTIFSDSAFTIIGRIINNILYFIFITFIVKILGEKKYSEYSLFLMTTQFLYIIFLVWTQSALLRYGREEFLLRTKINRTLTSQLILALPIIFLLIILIFIFRQQLLNYLGFSNFFIPLIILYFIMNFINETLYYSLQALGNFQIFAIAQMSEKFFALFILIIGYFLLDNSKLFFVIFSLLIGFIFAQVFIFFKTKINLIFPLEYDKKIFQKYLKYSIPVIFGSASAYFLNWIDLGIIKEKLAKEIIGQYFYCQQIFNGLTQLNMALFTVISPLVITLLVKNRFDLLKKILDELSIMAIMIALVIFNFLFFFLYFLLLYLFPNNHFAIAQTLMILIFSSTFAIFTNILAAYIMAFELMFLYSINNFLALSIKIILSYFFIDKFGMIGAALSTFVYFIYNQVFYSIFILQKIKFSLTKYFYLIALVIFQIFIFLCFKNIFISFFANLILIYLFAKIGKIFSSEKLLILNEINLPNIIKNNLINVLKFIG